MVSTMTILISYLNLYSFMLELQDESLLSSLEPLEYVELGYDTIPYVPRHRRQLFVCVVVVRRPHRRLSSPRK